MSNVAKVLLGLIYLLLACFLGAGCYFLFYGVTGVGLLAIGVFLFGTGGTGLVLVVLVGDEVENNDRAMSGGELDSDMHFEAAIRRMGNLNKTVEDGIVYICKDGIYLDRLYPTLVQVLYEDIRSVGKDGASVVIEGMFSLTGQKKNGRFAIMAKQPLKAKVLQQSLKNHGVC